MSAPPLVRARALRKRYGRRSGWRVVQHDAIHDVDLELHAGTTLAIVGDSGAGKSTLARCLALLEMPEQGELWFDGAACTGLSAAALRSLRPRVQLLFQDATTALNPRFTAYEALEEPLLIQRIGTAASRRERAREFMAEVGLDAADGGRSCRQFSGGQQQRIVLARALTLEPRLLVLDESFSGLDLATAAQIANLLLELQARHRLTYAVISHDLEFVARFADEIAVMVDGTIVERGPAAQVVNSPSHAATQRLVEASVALKRDLLQAVGTSA